MNFNKRSSMSLHAIAAWYSVSFLIFAAVDMAYTCMSSSGWKDSYRSFISLSIDDIKLIIKSIAPRSVLLLFQLGVLSIELLLDCGVDGSDSMSGLSAELGGDVSCKVGVKLDTQFFNIRHCRLFRHIFN